MKNGFRGLKVDSNSRSFDFKPPLAESKRELLSFAQDMTKAIKFMAQVVREAKDVAEKRPFQPLRPSLLRAR